MRGFIALIAPAAASPVHEHALHQLQGLRAPRPAARRPRRSRPRPCSRLVSGSAAGAGVICRSRSPASATTTAAPADLEERRALAEVRRVRAEEHRLPPERRLEHVVPARRHQAAADEDHVGEPVQIGELADRVEDDGRRRAPRRGGSAVRRTGRSPRSATSRSTSAARSGMARSEDRAERGELRAQARRRRRAPIVFLAAVGAARDPHEIVRAEAEERLPARVPDGAGTRSVLRLPVTTTRSAGAPSAMMRRASSSDCMAKTVTSREHRAHERPHQPIAPERAVGDAAVGDHARHAAAREGAQEVRPELRLHADEEARPHGAERAPHRARADRAESTGASRRARALAATMRAPVGVTVVTTSRSSGQRPRMPRTSGRGRRRLAHRDGVDPAARLGGQPRLDPPEPLPEVMAVAPRAEAAEQEERASTPQAPAPAPPSRERTSAAAPRGPLMRHSARERRLDLLARRLLARARSATRATRIGSPKRTTQRANGRGNAEAVPGARAATPTTRPTRHGHDGRAAQRARGPRSRASRPPRGRAGRRARPRTSAPLEPARERAERRGAAAGRRAAHRLEAEAADVARHQLAVARAAGEHADGARRAVQERQAAGSGRARPRRSRASRPARAARPRARRAGPTASARAGGRPTRRPRARRRARAAAAARRRRRSRAGTGHAERAPSRARPAPRAGRRPARRAGPASSPKAARWARRRGRVLEQAQRLRRRAAAPVTLVLEQLGHDRAARDRCWAGCIHGTRTRSRTISLGEPRDAVADDHRRAEQRRLERGGAGRDQHDVGRGHDLVGALLEDVDATGRPSSTARLTSRPTAAAVHGGRQAEREARARRAGGGRGAWRRRSIGGRRRSISSRRLPGRRPISDVAGIDAEARAAPRARSRSSGSTSSSGWPTKSTGTPASR